MSRFCYQLFLASALTLPGLLLAEANLMTLNFAKSSASRFGELIIRHSAESGDKLYLNRKLIDLSREGNSYTLALMLVKS